MASPNGQVQIGTNDLHPWVDASATPDTEVLRAIYRSVLLARILSMGMETKLVATAQVEVRATTTRAPARASPGSKLRHQMLLSNCHLLTSTATIS